MNCPALFRMIAQEYDQAFARLGWKASEENLRVIMDKDHRSLFLHQHIRGHITQRMLSSGRIIGQGFMDSDRSGKIQRVKAYRPDRRIIMEFELQCMMGTLGCYPFGQGLPFDKTFPGVDILLCNLERRSQGFGKKTLVPLLVGRKNLKKTLQTRAFGVGYKL